VPQRTERPQPKARPVLAMAASAETAPAAFSVPAPAPEPPAAAASAPVAAGPVQAAAPVTAVRYDAAYLHNPEPKYPPISRRLGEQGKVLLKVRVTAEGLPAAVDLERSSSFERLDEAARQVVGRWRFVPAKRGEQAIEASVIVPIVFRLEG
jgi:protein TonB